MNTEERNHAFRLFGHVLGYDEQHQPAEAYASLVSLLRFLEDSGFVDCGFTERAIA